MMKTTEYFFHIQLSTLQSINQNRSEYFVNALDFLEKMLSLPLSQLSNFRNSASNVLELVFVNKPNEFNLNIDHSTIIDPDQQDLYHVPCTIEIEYTKKSSINIEMVTHYQYNKGNYERMCNQMEAINFQHEFNQRDIDSAYEFFHQTMIKMFRQWR